MPALKQGMWAIDEVILLLVNSTLHVRNSEAPVCSPTLQEIGLQVPYMEQAGVAVDTSNQF